MNITALWSISCTADLIYEAVAVGTGQKKIPPMAGFSL